MLPQAFTDDPDRLARFEREARVLASLNHPNIGHIYGLEEAEGQKALVLELVEGPTLEDRIAEGSIPVDEALPIARQIAEALEAAHEGGVIHRDLKPANIKVKDDGMVKVLDFGLAKALDTTPEGDPSQSPTLTAAATQIGAIMGTAAYMSPEQARGRTVDKRGDVWAFGAVLYEMLKGQRAFAGSDVSEVLASVLAREPDWTLMPRDVSPVLDTYLRRCLNKDPKQRIGDVQNVRLALEGAFETAASTATTDTAVPQPTSWPRLFPWGLAAITGVALVLAVGWGATRAPLPAPGTVTRWTMNAPDDLNFLPANGALALSPDGTQLVFQADSVVPGESPLYTRSMAQLDAVPIRGTDGGRGPFFSPDGASIGFFADDELKRVAVQGGAAVVLAESRGFFGGSWGTDGTIIYNPGYSSGLWRVSADGGDAEQLTTPDVAAGELGHWWPQILPGDQAVVYTAFSTPAETTRLVVRSLTGDDERTLIEGGVFGRYLSSGHLLYASGEVLFAAPFDLEQLQLTGPATPVVEDVALRQTSGVSLYAVSANGSLAYFPASSVFPDRMLAWVDRGGAVESASEALDRYSAPDLSPDGTRVAMVVQDSDRDVFLLDLDRGTISPLTFGAGDVLRPQWTPDGEHVIYASEQRVYQLFRTRSDGNGDPEPLFTGDRDSVPTAVAPDGSVVAFNDSSPETGQDIWMLPLDGERRAEPFLVTQFDEQAARFSPDGEWVAYVSNRSGRNEVYLRAYRADAASVQVSTGGARAQNGVRVVGSSSTATKTRCWSWPLTPLEVLPWVTRPPCGKTNGGPAEEGSPCQPKERGSLFP